MRIIHAAVARYEMDGQVVPTTSQPSAFQQQGSTSWDNLASSTVQFSVRVLSRMSRAGLEALTVTVGPALCSIFILEPKVQRHLGEILRKLKAFNSFGKVIWFGFGLKHIIADLTQTEQGLACVALCFCLTTSYDSFFAAKVLRELWIARIGKHDLAPSLHQWQSLVDVCAGSLSHSKFPRLVEGLARLKPPSDSPAHLRHCHTTTEPQIVAEGLLCLGQVTHGELLTVTFTGGIDCAWLAAFAEWILSLRVVLTNASGIPFYQSWSNSSKAPQVIIIWGKDHNAQLTTTISKSFLVPPGVSLISQEDDLRRINAFPRCSSWSTLLKESFGSSLDDLLGLGSGTTVTSLLKAVAQASENAYFDGDKTALSPIEVIWRPFNFAHEDSRGRGYLEFVASRLPELTKYVKYRFLPSSGPRELSGGLNLRDNLFSLQEACSCSLCRRLSASAQETFKLEIPLITSPDTSFCLRVLAETIISYSWLLSRVEAHADVLPSSSALQLLYLETFQVVAHGRHLLESRTISDLLPRSIPQQPTSILSQNTLDAVYHLFSGYTAPLNTPRGTSAISKNGTCVYFTALEDLDVCPPKLSFVRVLRGHIEHHGIRYRNLCDPRKEDFDIHFRAGHETTANTATEDPGNLVYELIARDNEDNSILNVAYTASKASRGIGFAHVDCLRIVKLLFNVDDAMIGISCSGTKCLGSFFIQNIYSSQWSGKWTVLRASCDANSDPQEDFAFQPQLSKQWCLSVFHEPQSYRKRCQRKHPGKPKLQYGRLWVMDIEQFDHRRLYLQFCGNSQPYTKLRNGCVRLMQARPCFTCAVKLTGSHALKTFKPIDTLRRETIGVATIVTIHSLEANHQTCLYVVRRNTHQVGPDEVEDDMEIDSRESTPYDEQTDTGTPSPP